MSDRARAQRLERLYAMLDDRLAHAALALELLVAELRIGAMSRSAWRALHVAAIRDDRVADLGAAYQKVTAPHRMKTLTVAARCFLLVHAASFARAAAGNDEQAVACLERVVVLNPSNREAFERVERYFERTGRRVARARLYARAAAHPPVDPINLATKVINLVVPLPVSAPLEDDVLHRLEALVPANPMLLGVQASHCSKTGRLELACELRERALRDHEGSESALLKQRHEVLASYMQLERLPAAAVDLVEKLLQDDPWDAVARRCATALLKVRSVASRAAAALRHARRPSRPPPRSRSAHGPLSPRSLELRV